MCAPGLGLDADIRRQGDPGATGSSTHGPGRTRPVQGFRDTDRSEATEKRVKHGAHVPII